ncbi:ferric reductase-like transmembrane domain-containing protein [Solwaraspora sp. WMMA2056]|uniref:ferric reductase-like transmembrane domain-containing protein n=1 Tax=Solwaraspora sp. WMMA2056 TaxID=3015161 RepID=UPI00259AF3D5|nr:ferric reductase-like transmembrane domain-containing protein [Solwaraspora sp. WMMA2056]WJK39547.1 ferric reductase-like transmembrane domain-containing protein [Solwaraspora sp. WMMA2056]
MTEAGWFVARGTGVMALILLSVVVVLGVGSRSGRPAFGLPRFAVSLVHRNAALLSIGLLTVHVVTLLFDPYAKLRVYDLFVPFGAEYRPLYMGMGTVASDVMLVLVVTSLLRRHLRPRLWRALHWLAYASWPAAFGHSIGTGTDSGELWMLAVSAVCLVAVLGALGWRFVLWLRPRPRQPGVAAPARRVPDAVAARHASDAAPVRRAAGGSTDGVEARPARQWSYPSTADGSAPAVSGYASTTTSGSLLDMYRKPATSYQPVNASAAANDPPAAYGGSEGYGGYSGGYGQAIHSEDVQTRDPYAAGHADPGPAESGYAAAGYPDPGYPDPGYAAAGYAGPGYPANPGYADPGPPYQVPGTASDPDWSDDLRYQPAAEYVAMYRGEGYDPVGPAYPAVDPAHDTGTDPAYGADPGPTYDATDMYRRTTYPPAGDSNSYRDDPHAVSSGWRR